MNTEWAVYSMKTGACITGLGYDPEEVSWEEAQAEAECLYGQDVYVAERIYF